MQVVIPMQARGRPYFSWRLLTELTLLKLRGGGKQVQILRYRTYIVTVPAHIVCRAGRNRLGSCCHDNLPLLQRQNQPCLVCSQFSGCAETLRPRDMVRQGSTKAILQNLIERIPQKLAYNPVSLLTICLFCLSQSQIWFFLNMGTFLNIHQYRGLDVQNRQKSFSHQIWLVRAFYHLQSKAHAFIYSIKVLAE